MKIKNISIILVIILMMTIIGCNNEISNNEGGTDSSIVELPVFNIGKSGNKNYEIEFSDFNVGSETYTSSSGRILPYDVSGFMAIPKGEGKFPLVLITHGSHENLDASKEFYTGFNYLVKSLAESGYIAISMDMRMAYIWKYGDNDDNEKTVAMSNKQIEKLKLANEGNNPGDTIDLTNKIDFDKLFLIGHSRGGESVFDVANDQINRNVEINDAKMGRTEEELEDQLSRERQEIFLDNFAVDFFNISISKNTENTMYDLNRSQLNKIYDCDVKIQSINTKVNKLIDINSTKAFKSKNAIVESTQDSWFYADDKVALYTLTYGNEELKIRHLINIKWKSNKDKVSITPNINDFTNNSSLVFNIVIDSSDELNARDMSQCFSVEIKDKSGNISTVVLPKDLVILGYTDGELDSIELQ